MPKWVAALLEHSGTLLLDGAKLLFARRRLAFSAACGLLAIATLLGFWSIRRENRYQRLVEAALSKNTENTPQTLKALESLLLGYTETDDSSGIEIPFKTNVQSAKMSSHLYEDLVKLDNILRDSSKSATASLVLSEKSGSSHDAVITEFQSPNIQDPGYLFLPLRLLHISEATYAGLSTKPIQLQVFKENSTPNNCTLTSKNTADKDINIATPELRLCDDVLFTHELADILTDMTKVSVTSTPIPHLQMEPQQAYVISENGVMRIVSKDGLNPSRYRGQFGAHLVFPSRPYYLGAFKKIKLSSGPNMLSDKLEKNMLIGGEKENGYFYVSEPYLDIGGNGIVVTLARAFRYQNHSDGIIALDLKLMEDFNVQRKIADMVDTLGGSTTVAKCVIKLGGDPNCTFADGDQKFFKETFKDVQDELEIARRNDSSSDITGNMYLLSENPELSTAVSRASVSGNPLEWLVQAVAHPSRELRFTVPTGPRRLDSSDEVLVMLLVASLNVGQYLQNTAIAGSLSLFLFGTAITIAIGSLATDAKLKDAAAAENKKLEEARLRELRDLHDALGNVSQVMMWVNVPYVRLDNDDYVIDGNLALAKLFGLPPNRESIESKLRHTKFEDWIADQSSRTEYNRVQRLRRQGGRVEPYLLTFLREDGSTTRAKVVSSVVPASQTSLGGLPETFGILVAE